MSRSRAIAVPPYTAEEVLAAERKELATRILLALIGAIKTTVSPLELSGASVVIADALLAELAK